MGIEIELASSLGVMLKYVSLEHLIYTVHCTLAFWLARFLCANPKQTDLTMIIEKSISSSIDHPKASAGYASVVTC